ncbi:MAG: hypothetical protein QY325_14855 [Flavobacteriales bacterium]|nr:MAG: hypothetical protein QY325_14855 [Flavobacteriales bacterium]
MALRTRWVNLLIALAFLGSAAWVVVIPFFPSLDGWTHLYTARMLFEGIPEGVFCRNPGLVPNAGGHMALGALAQVLPPLVAERVFLAALILGLGLGTWALAAAFGRPSPLILMALPFTVNFLLLMGFHNFLLGLSLALLLAAAWISRARVTWWHTALLLPASLVILYTHTMALPLFLLLCGAHELTVALGLRAREDVRFARPWLALAAFVAMAVPALWLMQRFGTGQAIAWSAVDPLDNLRQLFNLRVLVLFGGEEVKFSYALKLILVGALAAAAIGRASAERPWRIAAGDALLGASLLLLGLYFFLPDSAGFASYITLRLQLMALLPLIAWMALQPVRPVAAALPVIMLLLLHQARLGHYRATAAPLAWERDLLAEAAAHLPEGSTVLPINRDGNWLMAHAAPLLTVERPVTLLDNYECATGYFPLIWCPELPRELRGLMEGHVNCLDWLDAHIRSGAPPVIDRIALFGHGIDTAACDMRALRQVLADHFEPDHRNAYVQVHRRRQ